MSGDHCGVEGFLFRGAFIANLCALWIHLIADQDHDAYFCQHFDFLWRFTSSSTPQASNTWEDLLSNSKIMYIFHLLFQCEWIWLPKWVPVRCGNHALVGVFVIFSVCIVLVEVVQGGYNAAIGVGIGLPLTVVTLICAVQYSVVAIMMHLTSSEEKHVRKVLSRGLEEVVGWHLEFGRALEMTNKFLGPMISAAFCMLFYLSFAKMVEKRYAAGGSILFGVLFVGYAMYACNWRCCRVPTMISESDHIKVSQRQPAYTMTIANLKMLKVLGVDATPWRMLLTIVLFAYTMSFTLPSVQSWYWNALDSNDTKSQPAIIHPTYLI